MIAYPIDLTHDDNDTILVTCPDFPELTTFGDDREDALRHAQDALLAMIEQYLERDLDIPKPSGSNGRTVVALQTLPATKIEIHRAMRRAGISQTELASRLKVDPRQVRRLLDLRHASRFEEIDRALAALGKQIEVTVRDAA